MEEPRLTVPRAYRQARALFDEFEKEVDRLGRLSDDLEGWHIVIDPGHGGIDPGSITAVRDGRGDLVYVVEDEYVYDITLRMYVLLRLHGAEVTLTVLSPNHVIRRSEPATRTFVHERNEVWNLASLNERNTARAWPRGGQHGLDTRVRVARAALDGHPVKKTVFLSIHADNSPGTPAVPIVFYHQSRGSTDTRSRTFARNLLPALGAGAGARGRNFGVLRNNPASIKVLIEVRNVAHADHAWALRFEELRQRDAEKVVRGIRDHVTRN
jgi:N-acetylmuramoyl-L-alanine amidase